MIITVFECHTNKRNWKNKRFTDWKMIFQLSNGIFTFETYFSLFHWLCSNLNRNKTTFHSSLGFDVKTCKYWLVMKWIYVAFLTLSLSRIINDLKKKLLQRQTKEIRTFSFHFSSSFILSQFYSSHILVYSLLFSLAKFYLMHNFSYLSPSILRLVEAFDFRE